MADTGLALISKVVADASLSKVMSAGVKPDWFEDIEHRKVYAWMLDYFSRYGETPTAAAVGDEYPNYQLRRNVTEPLDYYIDRFRAQRQRAILVDSVIDADTALKDDDHKLAQESLSKGLLRLGKEVNTLVDTNAVGKLRTRYDEYEEIRKNSGLITGVATGFSLLDTVSGGFHPEQFILFGGAQKQMKSFMLMKSAMAAHAQGKKALFLSFEMSASEQLVRFDAMACGINASKLSRGILSDEDMKKLKQGMRLLRNMRPFIVSSDISASTSISGLAGKIEQHQPDIIYIDGCYLMDNEVGAEPGSTQSYTSISRGLKRLAQRIKKPIVGTTQALTSKMSKDNAVTMHSLAWSSAWAQDADLIMGVERVPETNLVRVRVAGGRNVPLIEMGIVCNWEESIFEEQNEFEKEDSGDD